MNQQSTNFEDQKSQSALINLWVNHEHLLPKNGERFSMNWDISLSSENRKFIWCQRYVFSIFTLCYCTYSYWFCNSFSSETNSIFKKYFIFFLFIILSGYNKKIIIEKCVCSFFLDLTVLNLAPIRKLCESHNQCN